MNRDAGVTFSSGWWVSIEFLRDVTPNIYELAGFVHLPVQQTIEELKRWAEGLGLPYGVQVDVEDRSYRCIPVEQ